MAETGTKCAGTGPPAAADDFGALVGDCDVDFGAVDDEPDDDWDDVCADDVEGDVDGDVDGDIDDDDGFEPLLVHAAHVRANRLATSATNRGMAPFYPRSVGQDQLRNSRPSSDRLGAGPGVVSMPMKSAIERKLSAVSPACGSGLISNVSGCAARSAT